MLRNAIIKARLFDAIDNQKINISLIIVTIV